MTEYDKIGITPKEITTQRLEESEQVQGQRQVPTFLPHGWQNYRTTPRWLGKVPVGPTEPRPADERVKFSNLNFSS